MKLSILPCLLVCFFFPHAALAAEAFDPMTASRAVTKDYEEVLRCPLGKNGEYPVRILRRQADSLDSNLHIYYIQEDNGPIRRYKYYEENPEYMIWQNEGYSILDWAEFSCVGKEEKVFVMLHEPNAGRHVSPSAIRYNSSLGERQELSLGAEDPPLCIYLNQDEFILVSKNAPLDRKKSDDRYIAAKYVATKDMPDKYLHTPYTHLPSGDGYIVIPITPQIIIDTSQNPSLVRK